MPTTSSLFTAYNLAARFTRNGTLDAKRLRKGFGIAQSPKTAAKKFAEYSTTLMSCRCPDFNTRGQGVCKHTIARQLLQVAENLEK